MQRVFDFSTRARQSDPLTSKDAARRAAEFGADHHARILGSLLTQGEGTIHEIARRTGLDSVAIARRLSELRLLQAAEPTGETRETPSGRQARVWRAK